MQARRAVDLRLNGCPAPRLLADGVWRAACGAALRAQVKPRRGLTVLLVNEVAITAAILFHRVSGIRAGASASWTCTDCNIYQKRGYNTFPDCLNKQESSSSLQKAQLCQCSSMHRRRHPGSRHPPRWRWRAVVMHIEVLTYEPATLLGALRPACAKAGAGGRGRNRRAWLSAGP